MTDMARFGFGLCWMSAIISSITDEQKNLP